MTKLSDDFIKKVAHSLQEEEIDVYTLTLYCLNSADLEYFDAGDRKRIKQIFDILIRDTQYHADLLKLIVEIARK